MGSTEVAVLVLAVLLVLNLLLTWAVLRRLADHERRLADLNSVFATPSGLLPGDPIPNADVTTTTGRSITGRELAQDTAAVAFFSATCTSCLEHAPEFARLAAGQEIQGALAVVSGTAQDAEALLAALGDTATTVVAEYGDPFVDAYRVDTFPTYYLLREGRVLAHVGSAPELAELLGPTGPRG